MKTIFYHGLGESKTDYKNIKGITLADVDWNKVKATSAKGYKNIVSFSLGVVFALDEATKYKVENLILCSPTPFEHLKGIKAKKIWIIVGAKEKFLIDIFSKLDRKNLDVIALEGVGHRMSKRYWKMVEAIIKS